MRKRYVIDVVDDSKCRQICCFESYSFVKAIEFLETCDVKNYSINFYCDIPDYHSFDVNRILEVLNYV